MLYSMKCNNLKSVQCTTGFRYNVEIWPLIVGPLHEYY